MAIIVGQKFERPMQLTSGSVWLERRQNVKLERLLSVRRESGFNERLLNVRRENVSDERQSVRNARLLLLS